MYYPCISDHIDFLHSIVDVKLSDNCVRSMNEIAFPSSLIPTFSSPSHVQWSSAKFTSGPYTIYATRLVPRLCAILRNTFDVSLFSEEKYRILRKKVHRGNVTRNYDKQVPIVLCSFRSSKMPLFVWSQTTQINHCWRRSLTPAPHSARSHAAWAWTLDTTALSPTPWAPAERESSYWGCIHTPRSRRLGR